MAHFLNPLTKQPYSILNIAPGQVVEIALWGGGPNGEELDVAVNNALAKISSKSLVLTHDPHTRRFSLTGVSQGSAMVEARLGEQGPVWASMHVVVGAGAAHHPQVATDPALMTVLGRSPAWMVNDRIAGLGRSTWKFTTSEGVELDALIVGFAKGSFFLTDSADPDQIVHEILYVGLGFSTSKGPIPFGLGLGISKTDMKSGGVILSRASLNAKGFGGFGGGIVSGQLGGPGFGSSIALVAFPFIRAIGVIGCEMIATPGLGFTAMPCVFVVDP